MKYNHGDAGKRILTILKILQEKTDSSHRISMPNLLAELEEYGIQADRRTVYQAIDTLNQSGFPIIYSRKKGHGYYYEHLYSPTEVKILCDAMIDSLSISSEQTKQLVQKLTSTLSDNQKEALTLQPLPPGKTKNQDVTNHISILLSAIHHRHFVSFHYFDLEIDQTKKYRKNKQMYRLLPVSIYLNNNRYYGIFFDEKYNDFASYRLDKMERLHETEQTYMESVPFHEEQYLRSTFQMYKGDSETITARFHRSLSNAVFDQFGTNIIVSKVEEDYFQASIRSTVTPTLIAWILQFYDKIVILKPDSLVQQLQAISKYIQKTYPKKKKKED